MAGLSSSVAGTATILFRKLFDHVEVSDALLAEVLSYAVDVDWVDAYLQLKTWVGDFTAGDSRAMRHHGARMHLPNCFLTVSDDWRGAGGRAGAGSAVCALRLPASCSERKVERGHRRFFPPPLHTQGLPPGPGGVSW
jgi:hypothetical protein